MKQLCSGEMTFEENQLTVSTEAWTLFVLEDKWDRWVWEEEEMKKSADGKVDYKSKKAPQALYSVAPGWNEKFVSLNEDGMKRLDDLTKQVKKDREEKKEENDKLILAAKRAFQAKLESRKTAPKEKAVDEGLANNEEMDADVGYEAMEEEEAEWLRGLIDGGGGSSGNGGSGGGLESDSEVENQEQV